MGQGRSKQRYLNAFKKLSSLELANIEAVFKEISVTNDDGSRRMILNTINRQDFAERFRLPAFIGERLFHAFDKDENGTIDLDEFVGGIALCLHGTVRDKCKLLFNIFNLDEDDGVSRDELTAVLLSSLESAQTILDSVEPGSPGQEQSFETSSEMQGDPLIDTVTRIVDDAFKTCDITQDGKLSVKEFETWLFQSPKIMDNVFGLQCPKPEEGHWLNESDDQPIPPRVESSANEVPLSIGLESVVSLQAGDLSQQKDTRKLSDLFSTPSGDENPEGQSFFDSISNATKVEPLSGNINPVSGDSILTGQTTQLGMQQPVKRPLEVHKTMETTHDPLGASQGVVKPLIEPFVGLDTLNEPHKTPSIPTTPECEGIVHGKQTEYERTSSAWIPSPQTKQLLATVASGMMNSLDVDQKFLTSPSIVIEEPKVDPVKDMIENLLGEEESKKRQTKSVDSVAFDESGLKELLSAECWRAALEFTSRFLAAHGQGTGLPGQRGMHTRKTLQVWLCRMCVLFKLQLYTTAEAELESFGNLDQPDLYYEFYPDTYPGSKGSMVPFSMRLLYAEIPQYTGLPHQALDRLYILQGMCRKIISNLENGLAEDGSEIDITNENRQAAIELWRSREIQCFYAIGNCFLALKDYSLAVEIFESVIDMDSSLEPAMLSALGRICLQVGDVTRAQSYFKQVELKASGDPKALSTVVMNKGFVALATGAYEDAHKHFVAVTKLDPENSVATNNIGVCLLFLGRLKEALSVLEGIIWKDPVKNLHDGLLFNLCTIYELESSFSVQKKEKLLELVAKYKGDGFNVGCLKIA